MEQDPLALPLDLSFAFLISLFITLLALTPVCVWMCVANPPSQKRAHTHHPLSRPRDPIEFGTGAAPSSRVFISICFLWVGALTGEWATMNDVLRGWEAAPTLEKETRTERLKIFAVWRGSCFLAGQERTCSFRRGHLFSVLFGSFRMLRLTYVAGFYLL